MIINIVEFEEFILKIGLENAVSHKNDANPKALVGRAISSFPEIKRDLGAYMKIILKVCSQINSLSQDEKVLKLRDLNPDFFEKKERNTVIKSDGLPKLENTENGVVVRFEPAPSGNLHLGHLFGIVANFEVKKKFGGKFILRIGDTNSSNIDLINYEKVISDVSWICGGKTEVDSIVYQSDRLSIYYKYLQELLGLGKAFVCSCDSLVFKEFVDSKAFCSCINQTTVFHLDKFEKMLNGKVKVGDAVIRFKGDVEHKNPALRSFPLARINEDCHARVGFSHRVWPNMNLSVAIDDVLLGITHVIRGKDLEIGMHRQAMIHKALLMKSPEYFHFGRLNFTDAELSKSKLTEMIKDHEFEGWDDPRVPSLISFKRRGYKAEAFRKFILSLGISKRDSKIKMSEFMKGLNYCNKQILEKEADRFFFISNPKKVKILNISKIKLDKITLPKHPDNKSRGERHFPIVPNYLIDGKDFERLCEGDIIRLMHFANFKVISKKHENLELEFLSREYNKNLKLKGNIHFLSEDNLKTEILMTDNTILEGFCEKLPNLKPETAIQFERFGFVRLDEKDKNDKLKFCFTHT